LIQHPPLSAVEPTTSMSESADNEAERGMGKRRDPATFFGFVLAAAATAWR
jgi:hypothetical protein